MKLVVRDKEVHLDLEDPAIRLTPHQRAAMALDREVILSAGAGSGKTHTLSIRYVALLLRLAHRGEPDVESIVVMTFTEKAASEMAERCHQRLIRLTASLRERRKEFDALPGPGGAPLGGHLVRVLDALCDRFDNARISTFHGFCARLLRSFPVETNTPLDTQVLPPTEALGLVNTALEESLVTFMRRHPEDLARLMDAFGSRHQLLSAGRAAFAQRTALEAALEQHAEGLATLEPAIARAHPRPDDTERWLSTTGRRTLHVLERLTAPGGDTPFRQRQLLPTATELASPLPLEEPIRTLTLWSRYRRTLEVLLNASDDLRTLDHPTVMGPKAHWPDPRRYQQARAALTALQHQCADWPERALAARLLPTPADQQMLDTLTPFARWVQAADRRHQRALRDLGAVDFTTMQRRAIHAVEHHPELRQTLRKRHRYLVLDEFQDTDPGQWRMVWLLARQDTEGEDRLFLVGDTKQAIYGFRGGDVTVFRTAVQALETQPQDLPDNFRSADVLIDWFNHVFARLMPGSEDPAAPYEARYTPLNAGRGAAGGTVQVVLGSAGQSGSDAAAAAALIANEFLPEDGPFGTLGLHDVSRYPSPPIAILLRRRTHLADYEDALRERGVPFVVGQGVALWSRPEVIDVVNILHGLATQDRASVVGALRSPLFGVPDRAIQGLGEAGRLATFGMGDPPDLDPVVDLAWSTWRDLQQLALHASPSTVLLQLIRLGQTSWSPERGAPGRSERNVRLLIPHVMSHDPRGLAACAEFLLAQVLAGAQEAEAVAQPDLARVVLLTIHAAKGLEFPVVLIPEIHVAPRPESRPLRVGRPEGTQLVPAIRVSDPEATVQRSATPGLFEQVVRAARAEEDAEYLRLLYVAVTRARDHLVLLGEEPAATRPRRPSWADLVVPNLPATTRVRPRAEVCDLPIQSHQRLAGPPVTGAPLTHPPAAVPHHEVTPSRLAELLGAARSDQPRGRVTIGQRLAALRGQVLHGLFEDDIAHRPDRARARWLAMGRAEGLNDHDLATGWHDLTRHLSLATADPRLTRTLQRPAHTELGFRHRHGTLVLRGQIDRLWQDEDGHWVVLDYKTEALRGRTIREALESHRLQLLAYCLAASTVLEANGQPAVKRAEVFFSDSGEWGDLPWNIQAKDLLLHQLGEVEAHLRNAGTEDHSL